MTNDACKNTSLILPYCVDLGKATFVKPEAIIKLKLTSTEIKIALFYLHFKAKDTCTGGAINAAAV